MSATHRSLTVAEARHRAGLLRVTGYDVHLDLTRVETFDSRTTIRFTSQRGETFVDVKPRQLLSASLDGAALSPALLDGGRLPLALEAGDHELVIVAEMPFRNDGEGLHRAVDPADGEHYVYGMSFMDAAPSIFGCFDQPDLKAPYTFHVRAPRGWSVIGNAPGTELEPGVWELATSQPLSTYFVTLVAGPYHLVRDSHDGIPLGLSVRASLAQQLDAQAPELLTITGQCLDEFHRLFGVRYAFGDYHQAFVPEFNAGAMENPGCVTLRDEMIFASRPSRGARIRRASTIAHEMAHQWFGDLVTPVWWDDLWLNESFAEYLGNRVTADVTEYADAWTHNAYERRLWGLTADQGPNTHPVAGNGAPDALAALQNFDGISYARGSSVLRQLATRAGDEAFFAGVRDLLERHRFGNATMSDVFGAWSRAGVADLDHFVDQWLLRPGPDVIALDRGAGELVRTPPTDHPADREHTLTLGVLREAGWERLPVTVSGERTPVEVGDSPVIIDPDEQSWEVAVPDDLTWAALPGLIGDITDVDLLAGVWNNLRGSYQLGRVSPGRAVDLLAARFPIEDTDDTGRHLLPWIGRWVLPLAPEGSGDRLHRAALGRLESSPTGSAAQLSSLRGAIATAPTVEVLRGWLTAPPVGIDADQDLRWRLLVRLAVLGGTDRAEILAAHEQSPTDVSAVESTRALASLPTQEAKDYAWQRFTGEVDVPNYEVVAAGAGMWRAGQGALTQPFVERYFAELPDLAGRRSGWVLATATEAFFPVSHLDPAVAVAARELADRPDLDATIRRRLTDALDLLDRMLEIRRAYG